MNRIFRYAEILAIGSSALSVVGIVTALIGVFSAPQTLILAALVTLGYAYKTNELEDNQFASGISLTWRPALAILLLGLFFRLPAYDTLLGGQDQGVYIAMSDNIVRNKSVQPVDPIIDKLAPESKERYIADNYPSGTYMPGVYAQSPYTADGLEYQFYHLFPVWMATFSSFFGQANGIYALTFFALIGIIFATLLVLLLTKNRNAAIVAGLLVATNPLHAFFSKWPVTEVPAFALVMMGFTFLAIPFRLKSSNGASRYFLLSTLCFAGFFFTRISGLLYLPLVSLVAFGIVLFSDSEAIRKGALRWWIAVVAFYVLSVAYGLYFSSQYSTEIYSSMLGGARWQALGSMLLAGSILGSAALLFLARKITLRDTVTSNFRRIQLFTGFALVGSIVLSVISAYRFAFTDHFQDHEWYGRIAGNGWESVTASYPVAGFLYLCPLLLIPVVAFSFSKKLQPVCIALVLFLSFVLIYLSCVLTAALYQPYYARYLVPELIPIVVVFVATGWSLCFTGIARKLMTAIIGLSILYGAILSSAILTQGEQLATASDISKLTNDIESSDLVLITSEGTGIIKSWELQMPLNARYGLRSIVISEESLNDKGYMSSLRNIADNIYLISSSSSAPSNFTKDRDGRITASEFERTNLPPVSSIKRFSILLNRYIFNSDAATGRSASDVKLAGGEHAESPVTDIGSPQASVASNDDVFAWLKSGWNAREDWGVWSEGKKAVISINRNQVHCKRDCKLVLDVRAFVSPEHPTQRIRFSGRNMRTKLSTFDQLNPKGTIVFPIQFDSAGVAEITLEIPDATSPASLNHGDDARQLGLGVESGKITTDLN